MKDILVTNKGFINSDRKFIDFNKILVRKYHTVFLPKIANAYSYERAPVEPVELVNVFSDNGYLLDRESTKRLIEFAHSNSLDELKIAYEKVFSELTNKDSSYKPFNKYYGSYINNDPFMTIENEVNQLLHYFFGYVPEDREEMNEYLISNGAKPSDIHYLDIVDYEKGISLVFDNFVNILKDRDTPNLSVMANEVIPLIKFDEDRVKQLLNENEVTNKMLRMWFAALYGLGNDNLLPKTAEDVMRLAKRFSYNNEAKATYKSSSMSYDFYLSQLLAVVDIDKKYDSKTKKELKKLTRAQRKIILFCLHHYVSYEDLSDRARKNKGEWKYLFKLLHVKSERHGVHNKKIRNMADMVYNDDYEESFDSKWKKLLDDVPLKRNAILDLFESRPTEFLRHFIYVYDCFVKRSWISKKNASGLVLDAKDLTTRGDVTLSEFEERSKEILSHCEIPALLTLEQAINDLIDTYHKADYIGAGYVDAKKTYWVDGKPITEKVDDANNYYTKKAWTFSVPYYAEKAQNIVREAMAMKAEEAFNEYENNTFKDLLMPRVYLTENTSFSYTPRSTKDTSDSLVETPRGATFIVDETKDGKMKPFSANIWWTNVLDKEGRESRIDIDLSAILVYKDGKSEEVAYYNQQVVNSWGKIVTSHSGDFTNGGKPGGEGVSEFILLDLNGLKYDGIKEVFFYINLFNDSSVPVPVKFSFGEVDDFSGKFDPLALRNHCETTLDYKSGIGRMMGCLRFEEDHTEFVWMDINNRKTDVYSNASSIENAEAYLDYVIGGRPTYASYFDNCFETETYARIANVIVTMGETVNYPNKLVLDLTKPKDLKAIFDFDEFKKRYNEFYSVDEDEVEQLGHMDLTF